MAPAELKYESIGSSPDMDERGPMEVHSQTCFKHWQVIEGASTQLTITTTRERVIDTSR